MNGWQAFFFGNVRRSLWTILAIFVAASIVYPPLPLMLLHRFWQAFGELLKQLTVLAIVFVGIRMIIRGRR